MNALYNQGHTFNDPSALHALAEQLDNRHTSDLRIVAGEHTIHAHKIVLAARSPYFMALLYGPNKEENVEVGFNGLNS